MTKFKAFLLSKTASLILYTGLLVSILHDGVYAPHSLWATWGFPISLPWKIVFWSMFSIGYVVTLSDAFKEWMKKIPQPKPELTWETSDGRVLNISEMTLDHLKNTVKWMERQGCRLDRAGKPAPAQILNSWAEAVELNPKYAAMKARITELQERKVN